MTEFPLTCDCKLGMPEEGIARILGDAVPHPHKGSGIPRCELYLPADEPAASLDVLVKAGGKSLSPAELRNWGDVVAYGADLDGHILAFYAREV